MLINLGKNVQRSIRTRGGMKKRDELQSDLGKKLECNACKNDIRAEVLNVVTQTSTILNYFFSSFNHWLIQPTTFSRF